MSSPSAPRPIASPLLPAGTHRRPLGQHEVRFLDGFWGRMQDINATGILDTAYIWMTREGWVDNFKLAAAGALPAGRRGREFTDSDVYKLLEAMIWENARQSSAVLQKRIDELTSAILGAQEANGYLNTNYGRPGQQSRYSDMAWGHELYSYGHLLQAAVAELRTTGAGAVTAIARRVADHVIEVFGASANQGICGHPEIELGLIEFARATGDHRYFEQAGLFLERRGHGTLDSTRFGPEYAQDDTPIRDADVLRGHAVRAVYLSAAAVDQAIDNHDDQLLTVLRRQWARTITKRTYVTGGMGSRHEDEAFGTDYELPSEHAYSETCAAVGALMWTWRLAISTGEVGYADFAERLLFNVIATSPDETGTAFFYANTLHQRETTQHPLPDRASSRASSSMRAPWFDVSCCPPNVSRTLATLSSYAGWADPDGITIALWSSMDIRAELEGGSIACARVTTSYPDEGLVTIDVTPSGRPWDLTIRIPKWADNATVIRDGKPQAVTPGWVTFRAVGGFAETITLDMPMTPRERRGNPRIDSARAATVVERGPVVYALESVDLEGRHVDDFVVTGTPTVDGRHVVIPGRFEPDAANTATEVADRPTDGPELLRLAPYHAWGQRGPSTMRVWLRRE